MAEALFRELVKDSGDYEVASAGVAAMPGQPASRHTADILNSIGIDISGFSSQPVTAELVDSVTHIFAMGLHHIAAIEAEFPDAADKSFLITEFAADDQLRGRDIVDPFGMNRSAYDGLRTMLEAVLPSVEAYIDSTYKPEPS